MVDFVAYITPQFLTEPNMQSFSVVKDGNNFALYLSRDPVEFQFIYYPQNPRIIKYKEFNKDDSLYYDIKCTFDNIEFNNTKLDPNVIFFKGGYYSTFKNENVMIDETSCLKNIRKFIQLWIKRPFLQK